MTVRRQMQVQREKTHCHESPRRRAPSKNASPVYAKKKSLGQDSRFVYRLPPNFKVGQSGARWGAKRLRNKSPFMYDRLARVKATLTFGGTRGASIQNRLGYGGTFFSQTPVLAPLVALMLFTSKIRGGAKYLHNILSIWFPCNAEYDHMLLRTFVRS